MVTLNGVTSLYNISHCSQNNEVKPVWIYTNGEWINISLASEVIMEDGYLDTSKNNFYNATFDDDNYWTYYEGVGLYTSAINNGYYATVSTSETVNFSGYNQVIIKARVDSDSTYGIALVYLESPINQLHSTETYATITEYQQLSMTATDYVFDISTWEGEGYLGFVRYNSDNAKVWITDISLSIASLGGSEGSGDDSGCAEELVNAYTLFNSSTDILELDSSSWSCTDTTAADVLACDTSDGIFSIGFNGSFYFDGDVDGVRAYKDTTIITDVLKDYNSLRIIYSIFSDSVQAGNYNFNFGFTDSSTDVTIDLDPAQSFTSSSTDLNWHVLDVSIDASSLNNSIYSQVFFTMPLLDSKNVTIYVKEISLYNS